MKQYQYHSLREAKERERELHDELEHIYEICGDYYYNQHYIERYGNDKNFNDGAERMDKRQKEIMEELQAIGKFMKRFQRIA